MEEKKVTKFSEREITGKSLILPFVAVFGFLIITIGLSFAYFNFSSISTNNTSYLNAAFPAKANKTVQVTKTDCAITVTMADMVASANSNTAAKYTGSCSISVAINGSVGDTCTYNVGLVNATTTYTPCVTLASGTFEYSGTLSGAATKAETQMNALAGTTIAASQSIAVATVNTKVTKTYTLTTKWYNLNADQTCLLSSTAATTFRHQMKVTDLSCDMSH